MSGEVVKRSKALVLKTKIQVIHTNKFSSYLEICFRISTEREFLFLDLVLKTSVLYGENILIYPEISKIVVLAEVKNLLLPNSDYIINSRY